ncbi:MAG: hypothetical protein LBI53_04115 [Candidatus Peribacteria bacterium]|nr:hypothetical protein [Candidatus Peribacteria bacterium]
MFFRQYTKVIHYMQDRRSCLKEQIAEEKFQKGGKHTTLEDALDDEVWMEQYVYSDSTYKSFMSGKIHNAVDIMKERNIFNAELSMGVQKIVAAHDGERDRMLYYDKNTKQDAL